ncbi:MAG: TonB-dependent receptor, partial [Acidobacteriota bacterium]
TFTATLPNALYQAGNFSTISPNGPNFDTSLGVVGTSIATDGLGRAVYANAIYDPDSRSTTSGGVGIANVFPNNIIPVNRFSPVAVEIQKLLPALSNTALYNNYNGYSPGERVGKIPSIKMDHAINTNNKLSFFYNHTETNAQYTLPNGNADGLPELLTGARGSKPIGGPVWRMNYDATLTPTLLAHVGFGYSEIYFLDNGPYTNSGKTFDCAKLQLQGCIGSFNFPTIITANVITPVRLGGMQQLGNALAHANTHTQRPSANANLTWVRGNHTYKTGSEVWYQGQITAPPTGVGLTFANNATSLPASLTISGSSTPGFAYASFLLGDVSSAQQNAPVDARMHKKQWALFIQDSWKTTRKLTIDYGLRWDYATAAHEQYGRSANLGLIPNPAAGGRIGAAIFERTCGCTFVGTYPYAVAPRLGVAYQLSEKTVLRGGWGLAYGVPNDINNQNNGNLTNTPTGINGFATLNTANAIPQPTWPNFDPGQTPLPGATTSTFLASLDRNAARPPRQNQWSIGLQRELTRNFVIEASYVGNRGAWWAGPLGYLNQVSPTAFAAYGLNPYSNPADNILLGSQLSAAAVINAVGTGRPYSGYASTNTLINSLRPFPQFSTIAVQNSPTGNTWYDSLQVTGTHRLSHGLQVNGVFTWSKSLTTVRPQIFLASLKSHSSTDQPFVFNVNILYTTPSATANRLVRIATKDWSLGAFLQYTSGGLLTPPASTNTNFIGGSEQYRVAGEPLYLKDLNCGCINPYTDVVLNSKAWASPANGAFGPALGTFYGDYRAARRPNENFNVGRTFRITERVQFSLRGEFVNVFNRLQIGNPGTATPGTAPSKNSQGYYSGGFGVVNLTVSGPNTAPTVTANNVVGQLYQLPRSGTIIGRITF